MLRRQTLTTCVLLAAVGLGVAGTLRDAHFWRTAAQQGDALARKSDYQAAARVYADPWRIGWAQYRHGDFAAAAQTFGRVPGAVGAYNQGNSLLMHGKYDDAVSAYNRALTLRTDWQAAIDNRAIAIARRDRIAAASEGSTDEPPAEKPDDIVFDDNASEAKDKPIELAGGEPLSDEQLQATWLRRVQTTPGDFLRAKFAYQAQQEATPQ
ncbi:MAG: tetratricopeptide repeat protein [Pirellulales bacterium]|nr:tetratricopeptide repeat protein [Pirellulales bacterium]